MPHSHHSHSGQFCKHAKGSLDEVIQEAIRQGFRTFGLSEHVPRYREVDLYPEEIEARSTCDDLYSTFVDFLGEAHCLRTTYEDKTALLVGLETEYITESDLDAVEYLLAKHAGEVDYVVGSLHHVNEIPIDFDEPTFQRALSSFDAQDSNQALASLMSTYFDNQLLLLQRLRPEVIGHFDLCRLYRPELRFEYYPAVWEKVHRNVAFGISYGALFEVNAAAFRKGWNAAYPGPDVLQLIMGMGGKLCLSDDSHGPHAVGLNYHRLFSYLKDAAVQEISYLERADPAMSGRSNIRAQKLTDWWSHPFWSELRALPAR